jgi:type III restriction enzyme
VVRRKANPSEILLKIGAGEFEVCTEENIRNLLPIQAYSQKQLSSVGVSKAELKRLVYSPIRQALAEFELSFKNIKTDIRACYEKRIQLKLLQRDVQRNELELKSIIEQVEKLRKNLQGITDEDRATIEAHESFSVAEQMVDGWGSELSSAADSIGILLNEFENLTTPIPAEIVLPLGSEETIKNINESLSRLFTTVRTDLREIKARFAESATELAEFTAERKKWLQYLEQHKQKYNSAKERSSSQEVILNQISQLEERSKEIRKSITEKNQIINKLGDQEQKFESLTGKWILAHKDKADLIQTQCEQLAILSDNSLRATLGRGKGIDELKETLRSILAGANVRKDKIESICEMIATASNPIHEWHVLLGEFEKLAAIDVENDSFENFPVIPKLSAIGFKENDLKKVADKLNASNFIDLHLVQLEDIPVFDYKTREEEYIEFTDASAGQQATSLIHVLLNQEGPPLIIDQPEDDLDNQMISEISELVCKAKKNRQLIFTSHNANIVVNGDAELVACCDYRVTGDQSNGEIKKEGAIDIAGIREEITKVMEGGEKAFRLRKEKYGF